MARASRSSSFATWGRRAHLVLGVLAGLFVLLAAATGLLLQYPGLLGAETVEVTALADVPGDGARFLRGTSEGLERSRDGGRSWEEVPMLLPPGPVRRIVADDSTIYVLGRDGIVVSRDAGRIWESLETGVDLPPRWTDPIDLVVEPGGAVVLMTGAGIRRSDDGGETWTAQEFPGTARRSRAYDLVHDLHTGWIAGSGGVRAVTVGAVCLLVLVATGFQIAWRSRVGRRLSLRVVTLLAIALLLVACRVQGQTGPADHAEARFLMGTLASVEAWADDGETARVAVEAALSEMARIEKVLSTWNPDSELSRLNAMARADGEYPVSEDLAAVLAVALDLAASSGGAFDPTVLPLVEIWGFRTDGAVAAPSDSAVQATRDRVGYDHVQLLDQPPRVRYARDGVMLDFGGIAKGYALDRAAQTMAAQGASAGRLDLGGGILVFGGPAAGRVGIVDPTGGETPLGSVLLEEAAVATSGQYERFRQEGGRRWGHILDPRSGYPSENLLSVTVVAERAALADAAATACFVLGRTAGRIFLESIPGCEGILVHPAPGGRPAVEFTSGLD